MKDYFSEDVYMQIKNNNNLIFKALELVSRLFIDDVDKGGYPYLEHLISVYRNVSSENQKIVALLHDTIEDKNVTADDLIELGFPKKIVDDVAMLSRSKKIEYSKYIDKLVEKGSYDALVVKLADLTNNMNLSRIKNPTAEDYARVEYRYKPAYEKIINKLNEMES